MAGTLQQRIDRLKSKAQLLTDRYEAIKAGRDEAMARVKELESRVERLEHALHVKEAELEQMRVASVLVPDHRDVESTRTFLSELVREIDKCIAQLSI